MARTRSPDIEALVEVDTHDQRLVRLGRELQDLPQELARAEREVKRLAAELESARALERQLKKEIDQADLEVRGNKEHIGKYRSQQNQVKTNDEYTALKRQIEALEEKNRQLDDQALERYYRIDEVKAKQAEHQTALDKAKGVLASEQQDVDAEAAKLRAEIAKVEAERAAALAKVSPEIRKLYDRILERSQGRALARIDGGKCQACHLDVPRERVGRAHQGDEVVVCAMCNRILYIDLD